MNINEIVMKFCGKAGDTRGFDTPTSDSKYVYATNGHIIIRVDRDLYTGQVAGNSKLSDMQRHLSAIKSFEFKPLQLTLPPPITCRLCGGLGHVIECEDCDGEGWFEHGGYDYRCKNCRGDGVHPSEKNKHTKPCDDCEGTGNDLSQPVMVDNVYFQRRYIDLLLNLDGIKVSIRYSSKASFFTFNNGCGAIMALIKQAS